MTKTTKLAEQRSESERLIEGRYAFVRELGRGAQGRVWLALDASSDNAKCAVKVVPAADAARLRWEWEVLSRVQHPAIGRVLDLLRVSQARPEFDLPAGAVLMVSELHAGEPLDRALSKLAAAERWSPAIVAGFSVARALSAFHRAGLIHGDVKPTNVLWSDTQATLIDPGLAGPPAWSNTITGTPDYLAPEAWRGERTIAADSFALGMTLLRVLVDDDASRASVADDDALRASVVDDDASRASVVDDPSEHLRHALTAQARAHALLASIPDALRTLVAELLSPSPGARPTALETAARLTTIAADLNVRLPWRETTDAVGGGADELPSSAERVATFQTLPFVGHKAALTTLSARLAAPGVVRVMGPAGSGRSRLVREAVLTLQAERVAGDGPVPSYLAARELPERLPSHACVVHVQHAVAGDDAEALALVTSAEVDGASVTVVLECDAEAATDDDVVLRPLSRSEIAELLRHAFAESSVDDVLVDAALTASGGLAGWLCRLLVEHCHDDPDASALLTLPAQSASLVPVVTVPPSAQQLAGLLALAGGTLDVVTAQAALGDDAKLAHATQLLLERGLAALTEQAQLSLRPDVLSLARGELSAAQIKHLTKRALAATNDLTVRAYLLHHAGDPTAISVAAHTVVTLRDAGSARAAVSLGLDVLSPCPASVSCTALQVEVARTLLLLGRYPDAIALLNGVVAVDAQLCVAEAERRRGAVDIARQILVRALEHADEGFELEASLARVELDAGDSVSAQRHADRAVTHPGWSRVRGLEVQALLALRRVDHSSAHGLAEQAVKHARELSLPVEVARTLSVLATIELAQGDTATACVHYGQALELAQRSSDVHGAALCLLNLGLARVDRGEVGAGLVALRDASRRLLRLGRASDAARALYNVGNAASLIGDDDMALSALALASKAAAASQVSTALAYARVCEAELVARRDQPARALQCLHALEDVAGLSDDEQCVVWSRGAALHSVLGEPNAAQRWMSRARALDATDRSPLALAELMLAEARVCLSKREVTDALSAAERALSLASRAGTFELRLRAALCMAQTLEASGRPGDTQRFLENARQLLDQVALGLSPSARARLREVTSYRPAFKAAPASRSTTSDAGVDRWRKLAAFSKQLVGQQSASRLLDRVLDAALELANAERGFVVEQVDGQLRVRASRGLTPSTLDDTSAPSRTFVSRVISEGRALASVDALQDARLDSAASVHALSLRSVVAVPLRTEDRVAGAIYLDDRLRPFAFGDEELSLLSNLADVAALALDGVHRLHAEQRATKRLQRLRRKLRRTVEAQALELSSLRHTSDTALDHPSIIGRGPAMRALLSMVDRVARSELPVLIVGESGTGKELVARTIHEHGPRQGAAFVSENCSAIPETLLESALFGHVRGAFTGADRPRMGLFDAADGGTLFLDEIGEMSAAMQTRLLRVVQDGEIRPLGTERVRKVDVRLIAATHRDLEQMVRAGTFREDLYYRLAVVTLKMPALRDRPEDIPELVAHFARKYGDAAQPVRIDRKTLAMFSKHAWPGNVRQLENEIRRAIVLSDGPVRPEHLSSVFSGEAPAITQELDLREHTDALERRLIRSAMEQTRNNQTQAAKLLGVSRFGLQKMLKRLGLSS